MASHPISLRTAPWKLNTIPRHHRVRATMSNVKEAWSSLTATTARENNGTLVRLGLKPRDDAPTSMGRGWNACVPLTRGLGIDFYYFIERGYMRWAACKSSSWWASRKSGYLDVIESMLLTNDSGLLCTVLQATQMSDRDSAEFYLMRPETLSSWAKKHIKTTTKTCLEWRTEIGSGFGHFDCPHPGAAETGSNLRWFYRPGVVCEDSLRLFL